MNVDVEVPPHIHGTATHLGAGVPYALRVLARQLAETPDMGHPSDLPGILTVTVEGDLFEDCPALSVGYLREPDRVQIRYVTPISPSAPTAPTAPAQDADQSQERARATNPADDALVVRQIVDAWNRVTHWLQHNAPRSLEALRAGASPAAIATLGAQLGLQLPVELRTLWSLTAGDDGVNGAGCLPGNQALMPLEEVADFHRSRMDAQAWQNTLNAQRPAEDRFVGWRSAWVPVVSHGATDHTSGLYLDTATGYLGRWSRYREGPDEELDTLVTYLEDAADMLEAPALAVRDTPGLVDGALVWGSGLGPEQEGRWRPLTG
ncbi:SMI1/KNR4 family protein [Streptomyces buecherae]|uniref:SMI1/KNR4 family protein n=1 Tax=Streptomyces buecherae TaxID=2763006 RepID=A0A7H8N1W0_9ACTN|nr:SMI1/KNR4 family protein [Streptomyces buecherae]QKW48331.1 SMI1/KNR4 family protein [Streptomyces buecherae]